MNGGPATEVTEPAAPSMPTDGPIVALPIADVRFRRWRRHRNRTIYEVAWQTEQGGDTQSVLYRQAPAAHRHADRMQVQGYRATVTEGRISSWQVIR